jgi:hypothetical protein
MPIRGKKRRDVREINLEGSPEVDSETTGTQVQYAPLPSDSELMPFVDDNNPLNSLREQCEPRIVITDALLNFGTFNSQQRFIDFGPVIGETFNKSILREILRITVSSIHKGKPWEYFYVSIYWADNTKDSGWSYMHSNHIATKEGAEKFRVAFTKALNQMIDIYHAPAVEVEPQFYEIDFSTMETRVAAYHQQLAGRALRSPPPRSECRPDFMTYETMPNGPSSSWGLRANDTPEGQ